jgi:hypothetical protein
VSAVRERLLTFGPAKGLVGVLCEPSAESARSGAPAVLMANVGVHHRVGPNRLWVELSRRLASAGIPALRFDLSGMGDSEPRPGNDSELERGRADIADAMDVIADRGIATRFVLVALCSGVDPAHVVARDDARVVAAAFIDGYAHRTAGWYLRRNTTRFFQPRRWRLLFQRWVQRIRNGPPRPQPPPIYTRQYPDVATLEHDYGVMVDRHVELLFAFTGGMELRYNYAGQFHEMFQRDFRPHVQLEFLRRADHVFFNTFERERLLKRLVGWITDIARAAPPGVAARALDE